MQTEQQWRKPARLSLQSNLLASSRFLLHLSRAPNTSSQMQHCPAPNLSGSDCGFNLNGPLKRYERRPRILYFWQQLYEVAEQGHLGRYPTNGSRVAQRSRMSAIRQKPQMNLWLSKPVCSVEESSCTSELSSYQTMAHPFQLLGLYFSDVLLHDSTVPAESVSCMLALEVPPPFTRIGRKPIGREWRHAWAVCKFVCSS